MIDKQKLFQIDNIRWLKEGRVDTQQAQHMDMFLISPYSPTSEILSDTRIHHRIKRALCQLQTWLTQLRCLFLLPNLEGWTLEISNWTPDQTSDTRKAFCKPNFIILHLTMEQTIARGLHLGTGAFLQENKWTPLAIMNLAGLLWHIIS